MLRMSRSYTPSPLGACMAVVGQLYFYFYMRENLPLSQRKEERLGMLENNVLRITFVSKRELITGNWRKLQNEEQV
jgi:hypothetical protein